MYHLVKLIEFSPNNYTELLYREGENVFIFLDHPDYSTVKSRLYGKKEFLHTNFAHEVFFEDLKKCQHKWLITYDNSEYIQNLYQDFYQLEWELQYGMNNFKQPKAEKGKELLVANYDITRFINKENLLF